MALILKRVGRYEVLREIGRGGMATVYLARQTDLDRHVALKELATLHSSDEAFAERFLRESRMAGSLSHPNIVTVHDYFEHEGTPYISMEYIERGSLRPFIAELTLAQVGGVLEGLLAGLQHAGSRGIVHRDMKPENVMVTGEGGVKISDFGIGRALNQANASKFLTATGTAIGTPAYMAPEQAMAKEVGPWTDLYSLGIMAYEMVVGQVPFSDSDTPMSMLVRHVSEAIPAPSTVNPAIDPALSEWMEWLLQKDPAARPADAQKAWDRLEEIVIHLLGPRWRREARLLDDGTAEAAAVESKPLTPAPFSEEREKVETPDPVYVTYVAEDEEDGEVVPAAAAAAGAAVAAAAASVAADAVARTPAPVDEVATPPAPPAPPAPAAPSAPEVSEPEAEPEAETAPEPEPEPAVEPEPEPAAEPEPPAGGLDLPEEDMYLTFAPGSKAKVVEPPPAEAPATPLPPPPEPEPVTAAPEPEPAPVPVAEPEPVAAVPEPEPEPEPTPEPAVAAAAAVAAEAVEEKPAEEPEPEQSKEKRGFGKLKRPKMPKVPAIPAIPGVPAELQQFAPGAAEEIANVNAEAAAAPQALRAPSGANVLADVAPDASMDVANVQAEASALGAPAPSVPKRHHKEETVAAAAAVTGAAAAAAAAAAPEARAAAPPAAPPEPPAAEPPPPEPEPEPEAAAPGPLQDLPSDLRVTVPPGKAPMAVEPTEVDPASLVAEPEPAPEMAPAPAPVEHPSFVLTDAVAKIQQEKDPKVPGGKKIKPAYLIGGLIGIVVIVAAAVLLSGGSGKKKPVAQGTTTTTPKVSTGPSGPTGSTGSTGSTGPVVTTPEAKPTALQRAALAAFGGSLYVTSPGGAISKLDAGSLASQSSTTDPGGPLSLAEAYGRLWLADGKTLTSLNLKSLGPVDSVELPGGVALAGGQDRHLVSLQKQGSGGQLCVVTPQALSPCMTTSFVPTGALVTKNGIVYVVDGASGQIVPYTISASSLAAGSPMTAGKGAQGTPVEAGGKLYVPVTGGVAVIDLATGALTRTISMGATPLALVAPAVGRKIFAALYSTNKLGIIDTSKPNAAAALVPGGQGPVALVPTSKGLAVIDAGSKSVALVDPATGALSSNTHLSQLATQLAPIKVASPQISAKGQKVTVKLPFSSGSLGQSGLVVKSGAIQHGKATVDLWQGAITGAKGKKGQGLTVKTASSPGRLTVTVNAPSGSFTKFSAALGPGGHSVVFTLTKKPKPVTSTTTPVNTTPVNTTPVNTTPVNTAPVSTTPVSTSTPPPTSTSTPPTSTSHSGGGGGGIPGITVG